MTQPCTLLVTIGIPTYNRSASLDAAIASALAQDHSALEVIVCDNASTDLTADVCAKWMRLDPRVRYHRHASNIGAVANFNALPALASGDYFMWLADDDRISSDYVSACLSAHLVHAGTALVSGVSLFAHASGRTSRGLTIEALSQRPWLRVFKYLLLVRDNSGFYGLMPTAHARQLPMKNVLAGDWLLVMCLAFKGPLRIAPRAFLTRAADGQSADIERLMRSHGLPRIARAFPYLAIGNEVRRELWTHPDAAAHSHWIGRAFGSALGGLCIAIGQGLFWRSLSMASNVLGRVLSQQRTDALKRRLRKWMGV